MRPMAEMAASQIMLVSEDAVPTCVIAALRLVLNETAACRPIGSQREAVRRRA